MTPVLVSRLDPAAGAADPCHHVGGADIHCLVFFEGFCHMEIQAAGPDEDFQMVIVLLDSDMAVSIHFGQPADGG